MDDTTKAIWKKFHIKRHDTVPFSGWYNSTRQTLDELLAELNFNNGAEVGVCKGEHARALLRLNKNLKLLLVDPWCPYNRLSQEKADMRFDMCKKRLGHYEHRVSAERNTDRIRRGKRGVSSVQSRFRA